MSNLEFERYDHHGVEVSVRSDLKGRHKEFCLCYRCAGFRPDTTANCPIAEAVFHNCVKFGIVTPMWECPRFKREVR